MGFCRFKIYFLWKPLFFFFANLTTSGGVFLTEMVKRHIYGPRPFIWAHNQVSMTFRSKVLARTSYSLGKPLFWAILANLTTSGGVFLTEMVKRHIYWPRPFIWVYNQVSMTFRSKVLARTNKSKKNRYFGLFWPIWPLPVGCFWPKWSKRTSTDQDLSFEPITKSLWPSVQKF